MTIIRSNRNDMESHLNRVTTLPMNIFYAAE